MRYHSNGLIDIYEICHDYEKWVSSPSTQLKFLNFQNPRWRAAAILKTYIRNRLTDFDEIWQIDED